MLHKRAFNLLWGVNQGCSHLLSRGLEKGQPGVLVNTRRRLNALLAGVYFDFPFLPPPWFSVLATLA